MKGFLLTPAGQFVFDGQNNMVMVDEDDELMQSVRHIITTNLGEWFLNPLIGWDRFGTLGAKKDEERTITDLSRAILEGEGRVDTVEDIVLDYNRPERHLHITFTFTKKDGTELTGEAIV